MTTPFLVERARIRRHRAWLSPADVRVMRARDREAGLGARDERDVGQMRAAGVRVVERPHLAGRRDRAAITAATASGIAPRWTGMCSACAIIRPRSSNRAVEQSRRSLMFAENAERTSAAPISSAIARSRQPRIWSSTFIRLPVRPRARVRVRPGARRAAGGRDRRDRLQRRSSPARPSSVRRTSRRRRRRAARARRCR